MIDWEKIRISEDAEEIRKAKAWLFQENIRIQNERSELELLRNKAKLEQKRLREESLFFDKKMEILKNGFRQLEEDRKSFERERRYWAEERKRPRYLRDASSDTVSVLFRNTDNPLALRKRYRDLVKIYHPDNLFGDSELMQSINKEYLKRREDL